MDRDAPPERLNIVCKPSPDEAEVELPLRMLFVGNFMGRDERPMEERRPVRVDRDNFDKVLAAHAPRLDLVAATGEEGIRVSLKFQSLSDFGPDAIAEQVPEVARLLSVRAALTQLKEDRDGAAFRRRIEELLGARAAARLLSDLGLEEA
jgi:type VI secretion system protein ImpB